MGATDEGRDLIISGGDPRPSYCGIDKTARMSAGTCRQIGPSVVRTSERSIETTVAQRRSCPRKPAQPVLPVSTPEEILKPSVNSAPTNQNETGRGSAVSPDVATACLPPPAANLLPADMQHRDLSLLSVDPTSELWEEFIERSVDYIAEGWPNAFALGERHQFARDYDRRLREQYRKENRFLFLFAGHKHLHGLANLYGELFFSPHGTPADQVAIYVAEFAIFPHSRREGWGTMAVEKLMRWGQMRGHVAFCAEVDKCKRGAHHFWSRQGMRRYEGLGV